MLSSSLILSSQQCCEAEQTKKLWQDRGYQCNFYESLGWKLCFIKPETHSSIQVRVKLHVIHVSNADFFFFFLFSNKHTMPCSGLQLVCRLNLHTIQYLFIVLHRQDKAGKRIFHWEGFKTKSTGWGVNWMHILNQYRTMHNYLNSMQNTLKHSWKCLESVLQYPCLSLCLLQCT